MKILKIDIETSPNLAHVWGIWQQNVGLNQLLESGTVLCYAAKWLEDDTIYFDSVQQSTKEEMLQGVWELMNEADAIIHYNGKRFDIPTLNKEFLEAGFPPPSPAKQIDLMIEVKKNFKFVSNKLDYVSQRLGLGHKVEHEGHTLWTKCLNGDPDAWERMREYNIQDVLLLEKLYNRLQPWLKWNINHATVADEQVCPKCGGKHYHKRGYAYTGASKFQRYQCQDCGGWFRGNKNLNTSKYRHMAIAG